MKTATFVGTPICLSSIMYPFFNKLDVCLKKVNTVMYCHQKTTSVAPSPTVKLL